MFFGFDRKKDSKGNSIRDTRPVSATKAPFNSASLPTEQLKRIDYVLVYEDIDPSEVTDVDDRKAAETRIEKRHNFEVHYKPKI